MKTDRSTELRNCTNLNELIDAEYGPKGTEKRNIFDAETKEFCIAQTLREERIRAGLTQQQLADLMGTKKAYISRVETGKQNLNLTTLFRLFSCLDKKVTISIM